MGDHSLKPGLEIKLSDETKEVGIVVRPNFGNLKPIVGMLSSLKSSGYVKVNYDLSAITDDDQLSSVGPLLIGLSAGADVPASYTAFYGGEVVENFDPRLFYREHRGAA